MSINPEFLPQAKPVDEIGQKLLEAADLIRLGGLAKGVWCDDRAYCAIGAIFKVTTGQIYSIAMGNPTAALARARFERYIGASDRTGQRWNDAPGRTAEEVIEALTKAALQP